MPAGAPAGYLPNVIKSRRKGRRKRIRAELKPGQRKDFSKPGTTSQVPSYSKKEPEKRPQGVAGNRKRRKVIGLGDLRRAVKSREKGVTRSTARKNFLTAATEALRDKPALTSKMKGATPFQAAQPSRFRAGKRLARKYQEVTGKVTGPVKKKKKGKAGSSTMGSV